MCPDSATIAVLNHNIDRINTFIDTMVLDSTAEAKVGRPITHSPHTSLLITNTAQTMHARSLAQVEGPINPPTRLENGSMSTDHMELEPVHRLDQGGVVAEVENEGQGEFVVEGEEVSGKERGNVLAVNHFKPGKRTVIAANIAELEDGGGSGGGGGGGGGDGGGGMGPKKKGKKEKYPSRPAERSNPETPLYMQPHILKSMHKSTDTSANAPTAAPANGAGGAVDVGSVGGRQKRARVTDSSSSSSTSSNETVAEHDREQGKVKGDKAKGDDGEGKGDGGRAGLDEREGKGEKDGNDKDKAVNGGFAKHGEAEAQTGFGEGSKQNKKLPVRRKGLGLCVCVCWRWCWCWVSASSCINLTVTLTLTLIPPSPDPDAHPQPQPHPHPHPYPQPHPHPHSRCRLRSLCVLWAKLYVIGG